MPSESARTDPAHPADDELMTDREAAAFFKCTTRTVYSYRLAGLPFVKLGADRGLRYLKSDLLDWARRHRQTVSV